MFLIPNLPKVFTLPKSSSLHSTSLRKSKPSSWAGWKHQRGNTSAPQSPLKVHPFKPQILNIPFFIFIFLFQARKCEKCLHSSQQLVTLSNDNCDNNDDNVSIALLPPSCCFWEEKVSKQPRARESCSEEKTKFSSINSE